MIGAIQIEQYIQQPPNYISIDWAKPGDPGEPLNPLESDGGTPLPSVPAQICMPLFVENTPEVGGLEREDGKIILNALRPEIHFSDENELITIKLHHPKHGEVGIILYNTGCQIIPRNGDTPEAQTIAPVTVGSYVLEPGQENPDLYPINPLDQITEIINVINHPEYYPYANLNSYEISTGNLTINVGYSTTTDSNGESSVEPLIWIDGEETTEYEITVEATTDELKAQYRSQYREPYPEDLQASVPQLDKSTTVFRNPDKARRDPLHPKAPRTRPPKQLTI